MEEITNQNQNSVNKPKYSAKAALLSFLLSGIVAGLFLLATVLILENNPNFNPVERAAMGGRNITRIIYSFGLLTALFYLASLKFKKMRATAFFLIFYWIAGAALSALFLFHINNTPTSNIQNENLNSSIVCTRSTPYQMPEEFVRALSIWKQRIEEVGFKRDANFDNCIDIQYTDLRLTGQEGVMGVFSPGDSSPNDLKIYVDNVYVYNDDLLTAFLLSHEMTHAYNFIRTQTFGTQKSCLDNERDAYWMELNFIRMLNPEERSSIIARYIQNNGNQNPNTYSKDFFNSLDYLLKLAVSSSSTCSKKYTLNSSDWNDCRDKIERASIKRFLTDTGYCNSQ
jgi:hypothetical protein